MTIDEFTKTIDFPEMKLLGKTNNFIYYDEKNTDPNNEEGIPIVIIENKKSNKFEILDGEAALNALALFKE